jgi:oxygen-independent coproporphyrinogen-3 oxidase
MLQAITSELTSRKNEFAAQTVETIYFGGGTPSILKTNEIELILDVVKAHYVVNNPEITLECNPDDCTLATLRSWKSAGINRLSIGLQSFKASDLEWMNRAHDALEALTSIQWAKEAGFENYTIDLMYGLPGLTIDEWRNHIQTVIDLDVPHISSYCLTVEEKTALQRRVQKGTIVIPDDEAQSLQFETLLELLETNGYKQYEISNFAKPGLESKHNSNYWKGVPYLGVGPSAHSFDGTSRRWNVANNQKYMQGVEKGFPYWEQEELSSKDRFNELILTGLRTVYGVGLHQLREQSQLPKGFLDRVKGFEESGWMEVDSDTLYLTKEGRLRADFIASELFLA